MSDPTVTCDLTGVTPEQRARHAVVSDQLLAARTNARRDGDTWSVFFDDGVSLATLAEFLEFERRCCAFLDFDVCGRGSKVCLELSGAAGAAELIGALFPLAGAAT